MAKRLCAILTSLRVCSNARRAMPSDRIERRRPQLAPRWADPSGAQESSARTALAMRSEFLDELPMSLPNGL